MTNHVPSNYTSMEVLSLARDENPNPSPVLEALFKRCELELTHDAPNDSPNTRGRRVCRASVR